MERLRGGGDSLFKAEKWFVAQEPLLTGNIRVTHYSSVIPERTIINEVQIHLFCSTAFALLTTYIKIFVCTDDNLSLGQINQQECIINFDMDNLPGLWASYWAPRDEIYELQKMILGTNNRIGIDIRVSSQADVGVRVAVKRKEP